MDELLSSWRRQRLPQNPVGFMPMIAYEVSIYEWSGRIPFRAVLANDPRSCPHAKENVIQIVDTMEEAQCLLEYYIAAAPGKPRTAAGIDLADRQWGSKEKPQVQMQHPHFPESLQIRSRGTRTPPRAHFR